MYTFRDYYIPEHMQASLELYIREGIPVGSFLEAVLCNNLRGAVAKADDENLRNLPAYVNYLYNDAPVGCHGNADNYNKWLNHEGLKGINKQEIFFGTIGALDNLTIKEK